MRSSTLLLALCALLVPSLALVTQEQQPLQEVASGPIHTTDSWSWKDCGE